MLPTAGAGPPNPPPLATAAGPEPAWLTLAQHAWATAAKSVRLVALLTAPTTFAVNGDMSATHLRGCVETNMCTCAHGSVCA